VRAFGKLQRQHAAVIGRQSGELGMQMDLDAHRASVSMPPTAREAGLGDAGARLTSLRKGRPGATLDVVGHEPLAPRSLLCTMPNVLITAHSMSDRGKPLVLFCDNLRRYLAGEPSWNQVDKVRGY
jgi:hypothetical protein